MVDTIFIVILSITITITITILFIRMHNVIQELKHDLHNQVRENHAIMRDIIQKAQYSLIEKLEFNNRIQNEFSHDILSKIQEVELEQKEYWTNQTISDVIHLGSVQFYISYRILSPDHLAKLLEKITKLYKLFYFINITGWEKIENVHYDNIELYIKKLWHKNKIDALEIHSINTGESIKIEISTGWKPTFRVKDGDYWVGIPKGAVSLIFMGMLLSFAFNKGISALKNIVDIQMGIKDMNLKELQIEETRLKIEDLQKKLGHTPKEILDVCEKEIKEIENLTSDLLIWWNFIRYQFVD